MTLALIILILCIVVGIVVHKHTNGNEDMVLGGICASLMVPLLICGFITLVYAESWTLQRFIKHGQPGARRQFETAVRHIPELDHHYAYGQLAKIEYIQELKELCDKDARLKNIINRINSVFIIYTDTDLYTYDPYFFLSFDQIGNDLLYELRDIFSESYHKIENQRIQDKLQKELEQLNGKQQ